MQFVNWDIIKLHCIKGSSRLFMALCHSSNFQQKFHILKNNSISLIALRRPIQWTQCICQNCQKAINLSLQNLSPIFPTFSFELVWLLFNISFSLFNPSKKKSTNKSIIALSRVEATHHSKKLHFSSLQPKDNGSFNVSKSTQVLYSHQYCQFQHRSSIFQLHLMLKEVIECA